MTQTMLPQLRHIAIITYGPLQTVSYVTWSVQCVSHLRHCRPACSDLSCLTTQHICSAMLTARTDDGQVCTPVILACSPKKKYI